MARTKKTRPAPKPLIEKFSWGRSEVEGPANWQDCDPQILLAAVHAAASIGWAMRFGLTRDGGAFAIGLYMGADGHETQFVRPSEDLEGFLADFTSHCEAQADKLNGTGANTP